MIFFFLTRKTGTVERERKKKSVFSAQTQELLTITLEHNDVGSNVSTTDAG